MLGIGRVIPSSMTIPQAHSGVARVAQAFLRITTTVRASPISCLRRRRSLLPCSSRKGATDLPMMLAPRRRAAVDSFTLLTSGGSWWSCGSSSWCLWGVLALSDECHDSKTDEWTLGWGREGWDPRFSRLESFWLIACNATYCCSYKA